MTIDARWAGLAFALSSGAVATPALHAVTIDQRTVDQAVADAKATMLIDPSLALSKANIVRAQSSGLSSANARAVAGATADWLQAEALLRLNKSPLAMPIASRALRVENALAPRSKLAADTLLTRGGVFADMLRVGAALTDYQAAFRIYRVLGDQRGQTIAILCIAELYRQAKDYDSVLKYLDQANDLVRSDPKLMVTIDNNRALVLVKLKRYHEAEAQFRAALTLAKGLSSATLTAQILGNLARCQLNGGSLSAADKSIAEELAVARRAGLPDEPIMLSVRAQAALQHGDHAYARTLIDRVFVGIDLERTSVLFTDAHQAAYDVYHAIGRPDVAIAHLAALKRLDDQATKLATTTSTALMAARFDFANLKADELQRSIGYERQQAKTERFAFIVTSAAAAIVMLLLAFALFVSRRGRLRVAAANADLAQTNAALGKALAAKTEFLATTSHEIRTPLNGILGMTQVMLADTSIGGDTRDRLGIVHGAGITMRALVDDILDVAKMETGNLTIERAPFDLAATIREATRLWEDQATAKGIAFVRDLEASPRMIEGDAARVRQIIFNLLSNALKFTPSGRIALTVAADGQDRYRIAVQDSGIGIAADKTTEIFESFRQADAGTTRQFGGTGLGLAICRNLARAMGGEIAVDSVPGEGSTFTVSLPLVRAKPVVACQTQGEGGPGILIVDRNPIARAMLRALLSPQAGTVAFASSAAEATACLPALQVAQILIDDATIRADADPMEAMAVLAEAARAQAVRTVLLWPVAAPQERAALMATGIDLIVAKPVSGAALVDRLYDASLTMDDGRHERLVPRAA